MVNNFCIIFAIIVAQVSSAAATNCPDAGVVVVASVFATLAVVFVVLGIIGILLWKRRRDISRPEKLKPDVTDNHKYGYTNQAFDAEGGEGLGSVKETRPNNNFFGRSCVSFHKAFTPTQNKKIDRDRWFMFTGAPGYVACRESQSIKNTLYNYGERDLAKKTWSSLPPFDVPDVRQRKSSLGSLDRNKLAIDNNTEEVWLTSQDFIGLGFNIAGSMRDGIFVSQVHNRGPANESGKFKVGDRIMHVGISFENMVYEDALTILSYASPYPVKVTLQKQQSIPKNRKLSDVRTNLNHPLYRSHSVDVIDMQTNEKVFFPKRAASEMRYNKNDSINEKRLNKSFPENSISEEVAVDASGVENEVFESPAPKINAVVHRVNTDEKEKLSFDREVSIPVDSSVPSATVDLNTVNLEGKGSEIGVQNQVTESHFVDPFENLSEQDKIDMLRLSYADPDAVTGFEKQEKSTDLVVDQKSAPLKPERKKKRSSTNSTSPQSENDMQRSAPSTPQQAFEDEVFRPVLLPPTEAPPPVPENEAEVDEELILPDTKSKSVVIGSNSIVLEAVSATPEIINEHITNNFDIVDGLNADSLDSGEGSIIIADKQQALQTEVPDDNPVIEEAITATHVQKKSNLPNTSSVQILNENTGTDSDQCVDKSTSEMPIRNQEQLQTNAENVSNVPASQSLSESDDVFEKGLSELDLNLNFDIDSVLFKDPQYAKNEKEKENSYAYDISVTELEAMEQKVLHEERKKHEQSSKKGGIAYEIRDDFVTGELRTVNHLNIHRTASYDTNLTSHTVKNLDISLQRPTSFKGEMKTKDENDSGALNWSGKRLVRSGSFSEIPQDDSVKVWTDNRQMTEDDALMEKRIQEDSVSPALKKLTRATLVQSKSVTEQDQDHLSDSDSQCRSISSSDSSDDNTEYTEKSKDGGLNAFIDDSSKDKQVSVTSKTPDVITENHTLENNQAFTVTLKTADNNNEEDC